MKRTFMVAAAGLAAVGAAGIAVADGIDGAQSARSVAGAFSTGSPSQFRTRSCTTADGKTLVATQGVYTGGATGDADFTGPITLRAHSLINSTDGVGVVSGTLRIKVAAGGDTVAHFESVYSGGQIAGLASGHAQDRHAKLLSNLSASFDSTSSGGFGGGKLGGTTGGGAVELGPGRCEPSKTVKETSEARGIVTTAASTITVAGLTCTVPASLQAKVSGLLNAHAEIRCSLIGGANTLTSVEKK